MPSLDFVWPCSLSLRVGGSCAGWKKLRGGRRKRDQMNIRLLFAYSWETLGRRLVVIFVPFQVLRKQQDTSLHTYRYINQFKMQIPRPHSQRFPFRRYRGAWDSFFNKHPIDVKEGECIAESGRAGPTFLLCSFTRWVILGQSFNLSEPKFPG